MLYPSSHPNPHSHPHDWPTLVSIIYIHHHKVLATEMSKASVELAMQAFKANNITNTRIARLSSEEFTEAYEGSRVFQRLEDAEINCKGYQVSRIYHIYTHIHIHIHLSSQC